VKQGTQKGGEMLAIKIILLICCSTALLWNIGDGLLIPTHQQYGDEDFGVGIILQDRLENDKKFLDLWKIPRNLIF
jgi:hypothetical protein